MKNKIALIISGHLANSKRKASIHFMAENMAQIGYQTHFLTIGLSPISKFKHNDERINQLTQFPINQWYSVSPNFQSFIWYSVFHPFNLKHQWLNTISTPLFQQYPHFLPAAVKAKVKQAKVIIIESGLGVILIPKLKHLNPHATFIYTASDRLSTLNAHPMLENALKTSLSSINLVRVPAQSMLNDFKPAKTIYIPQGIDKTLFSIKHKNPYKNKLNAISIGNMLFDEFTIEKLSKSMTNVTFHLFGKGVETRNIIPNVIIHGEKSFSELIPYLQHATFGIAPYKLSPSADYLSQSSLKMIQYTHCQLPIVAPAFAATGRPHVCAYQPGNATSIIAAGKQALKYPHNKISKSQVLNWEQTTLLMLKHAGLAS